MGKKKVVHLKFTNMAWGPDAIIREMNKYSEKYESVLCDPNITDCYPDVPIIRDVSKLDEFDIVHFHNKFVPTTKPNIMQYHSPIYCVDMSYTGQCYVVSQFWATLEGYKNKGRKLIRNPIALDYPVFQYKKKDTMRIGFSPSKHMSRLNREPEGKGWELTDEAFERLKTKNPNVEFDIIHDVSYPECLERKSKCSIVIDECISPGFHRSGLEGLACGALTVCSLGEEVSNMLKQTSGSDIIPFESNIWIEGIHVPDPIANYVAGLQGLIDKGLDYQNEIGKRNRDWMEKYWNPKTIAGEVEQIYDELLANHK